MTFHISPQIQEKYIFLAYYVDKADKIPSQTTLCKYLLGMARRVFAERIH